MARGMAQGVVLVMVAEWEDMAVEGAAVKVGEAAVGMGREVMALDTGQGVAMAMALAVGSRAVAEAAVAVEEEEEEEAAL